MELSLSKNQEKGSTSNYRRMLYLLMSFFIPFIILVLSLIALHVTPFGDHNLCIMDAKFYINGQMFFSRLLKGEENILYSFNQGLGGNEWSSLAWGGVTLGNFLSLFASLETIPSVFTWICVVNLSICGVTMYLLLAYVNGHRGSNLIFSTSYALIGFNIVNCYQTGFILGPELLPLVMLGLFQLLKGYKPFIYIFSLAVCTFFNFYFAFHLCVISVIFFFGYFYVYNSSLYGKKFSLFIRWMTSSVIGGLLAAPMWLPALKAYSGGGRLNQTKIMEYSFEENMPFIQMFSKLFSGANSSEELVMGMPNIFCGILVVALVVLYYINKKIDVRKKYASGFILSFYLVTFYIKAFTLAMHGGTHTNWFPYRYSYVFSFLLICLAVEEFRYIPELTVEDAKRCGVIILISALIVFSTSYEFISGGMVLLDLALLLFMWVGFWFFRTRPDKAPLRTLSMLLLILVSGNMYVNIIVSTASVRENELDLEEYNKNIMISGALIEALNKYETNFYRMEKDKSESMSIGADSKLYNYNGVSRSGPTERAFVHQQLSKLGINWFDMRHWYSEGVPAAVDDLLGLKYIISERDLTEEKKYEQKVELSNYKIYYNPNSLSVAILADENISNIELGNNAFKNLNDVWKQMTGETEDIFTEQEDVTYSLFSDYSNQSVTSKELEESYGLLNDSSNSSSQMSSYNSKNISESGLNDGKEEIHSYIQYTFKAIKDGPIYLFDTSIPDSKNGLSEPTIRYVGTYKTGDVVEGQIPLTDNLSSGEVMRGYCVNLVFAYADNEILSNYAKQLNARDITFDVEHENDLKGRFTAQKGQRVLFTIPWDEGWTCYIDGQKVDIDKTWDLFMSVEVPEGQHIYEMKFYPAWMNYGLILFIISILGLISFMLIAYRKKTIGLKHGGNSLEDVN